MSQDRPHELKGTGYELFILMLSILSVVNALIVVLRTGPASDVALAIDTIMVPIFMIDFLYRLLTARSRSNYFLRRWGWADLLASLPLFRVFRVFRIIRVVRLTRAYGAQQMVRDLEFARASATFYLTMFLVILVVEVAGISIYFTEQGAPDANIKSAGDAIWWGLVTITTVGYGDRYPVTGGGRIVGVFLLFAGIALFSVLTGFIANAFLAPRPKRKASKPVGTLSAEVEALGRMLDEHDAHVETMRERLHNLERMVTDAAGREEAANG